MFQFNSELYKLAQKYQELTKQEHAHNWQLLKQDMLILLIGASIIITLSLVIIRVHKAIVDKKLKELKNDKYYVEDLYKDEVNYYDHQKIDLKSNLFYLFMIFISVYPPVFMGPKLPNNHHAPSVIKQYKLEHETSLKNFDDDWLVKFLSYYSKEGNQLIKIQPDNKALPNAKYIQFEPVQDDDAPVGKTRITNQIEIKNEASNHTKHKTLDEVQLVKIENLEGKTFITAYIKIKDKWHKVQIQDALLDDMLEQNTEFYFDENKNELVVGV